MRVADHPISIEEHDEAVLSIQQVIDLLMYQPFVVAEHLANCHGRKSAAGPVDCFDGRVRDFACLAVAEGRAGLARSAVLIVSERVGAAGMDSADSETTTARDRRNVRSLARSPKVANDSAHNVRASTCGQSSSHAAAVRLARRRRSWATMESCQALSRAHSDAASSVPTPEPKVAYGFMSDPILSRGTLVQRVR
jgi:hypothetical protein